MRKQNLFIILALLLCLGMEALAQTQLCPKQTIGGQEYYIYTVEQGDGFWGISKKFGVTQAELHQYNPAIAEGLQVGQKLQIPIRQQVYITSDTPQQSATMRKHVVEKGQTIYAISRMYGVGIDDIATANPAIAKKIRAGEIHIGDVLNIPAKREGEKSAKEEQPDTTSYILHEVKKKETLYSISRQYNVEINDILEDNNISGELQKGQILKIRTGKKQNTPATSVNQEPTIATTIGQQMDIINDNLEQPTRQKTLRIAVLMPFKLKTMGSDRTVEKFVNFYRGVLLAANELKAQGLSTDIYAYDTGNIETPIDSVLQNPELAQMDLIIGPAYSNHAPKVMQFAKQQKIYTVIPFTQNTVGIEENPYVFQFNPSAPILHRIAIAKMLEQLGSKRYLIAYLEDCSDNGNKFAESFQAELTAKNIEYTTCVVNLSSIDSIAKVAISDNAVVLLASNNTDRVRPLLRVLRSQVKLITIIGFDEWGDALLKANKPVCYYSLFEKDTPSSSTYDEVYKSYFGANDAYPSYDKIGYDLTTYILQAIMQSPDGKTLVILPVTQGVQTTLNFVNLSPQGGWMNQNVYVNYLR